MLPQAYVYPPAMRATRDRLRRRTFFTRKRADLLTHIQNTTSQYNLPAFEHRITYAANRTGVAEQFPDPAVRQSVAADLALLTEYDRVIGDLELFILRSARPHDPQALSLLRTVPGIGKVLSLVLLYEIQDIHRFPTVQDFVSYARLVKCAKESAGKRYGSSGSKIGNAHLKWAFSEAAVLFLRGNPAGQTYKARLERTHGKAKALAILAHRLGRAVYFILLRQQAFDMTKLLAA